MNIALVDVDGHHYPNLALMRLSAWHKAQGDSVEWYSPLFSMPKRIYASKVFSFSLDYRDYNPAHPEPERGGTGYDLAKALPPEVEATLPDYSIYPWFAAALGFTTRGCPRNCRWCVVPRKEGMIRPVDDIERIAAGRREVILMDNNFLAAPREFVKEQLEKARAMNLKIDFNQGLDARLIDDRNAIWLARCRWSRFIRLSCDSDAMFAPVAAAVRMLRRAGFSREIFVYVLAEEAGNALSRIERLVALDPKIIPFCQPFRDIGGTGEVMNPELKRLARWCNRVKLRKSCTFAEFRK